MLNNHAALKLPVFSKYIIKSAISCKSSWNKIAIEVPMPKDVDFEKADAIVKPSKKLCKISETTMTGQVLRFEIMKNRVWNKYKSKFGAMGIASSFQSHMSPSVLIFHYLDP